MPQRRGGHLRRGGRPWAYYVVADSELADAWCEACFTATVPVDFCETTPVDNDGDTYTTNADCNDDDDAVNPAATEVCDNVDNNCDGAADEGIVVENGACEGGELTCDSGYSLAGEICTAWRDAWVATCIATLTPA